MKQAENLKNHIGIPTHRSGPKIPFLMFADDCIIFAKASQNACNNINRILQKFCALSGQLVNFRKSIIQISNNIQGTTKRRLGEALRIPTSNDISKYLGCPLVQGRVNRISFAEVVLKSQKKLASWKARFLLRAGKVVLMKSNLASSPLHVMNCFKLTKNINEDLDKINRKFLWALNIGFKEAKGFPLVAWDEVCRPKSEGGLGIRRNEDVNKATITKLGWRILTDKDSLWARIMRDKYVKVNNFFNIPKKEGDSVVWKEVINHRKYIGASLK